MYFPLSSDEGADVAGVSVAVSVGVGAGSDVAGASVTVSVGSGPGTLVAGVSGVLI